MRLVLVVPFLLAAALPLAAQSPVAPRLDAAARSRIADSAAVIYRSRYPDEAIANRLADSLRAWSRRDRWRTQEEPAAFAAALQADVRTIVNDRHLWYTYRPDVEFVRGDAPSAAGMVRRSARIDPRDSVEIARRNFGVPRAEVLEGNVGYLRLTEFVPLDWSRPTLEAALSLLRHTDAVIIDVRSNRGGSPDNVGFLLSQFLGPEPQVLFASRSRVLGRSDTLRSDPAAVVQSRLGVPLYILTDGRSASAAEMLPYIVKQSRLGTVVGERSAGAGNGGVTYSIGSGLQMFAPERQTLSGPGWEGIGVEPDVAAPSAEALDRALALIRERRTSAPR